MKDSDSVLGKTFRTVINLKNLQILGKVAQAKVSEFFVDRKGFLFGNLTLFITPVKNCYYYYY